MAVLKTTNTGNLGHPESDNPNEPTWNFVAVFWGIGVIFVFAFIMAILLNGWPV